MQSLERTCPHKNEEGKCEKQPGMQCHIAWYPDCKIYQEHRGYDA